MKEVFRQARRNWRTTLVGFGLGLSEILGQVTDVTSLSWQELFQRTLRAIPIVLLGMAARDHVHDHDEPRRRRKEDDESED